MSYLYCLTGPTDGLSYMLYSFGGASNANLNTLNLLYTTSNLKRLCVKLYMKRPAVIHCEVCEIIYTVSFY